jgi:hypothetical protein
MVPDPDLLEVFSDGDTSATIISPPGLRSRVAFSADPGPDPGPDDSRRIKQELEKKK